MKDQETKERFIELRAQGLSFDRISKELKVSKQTLIDWSRDLEREIANLRAIELETLQEKYYQTKTRRIELFGEKLKAIIDALDKRDLSDVPTEKLFDLLLRYDSILKAEAVELRFEEKVEKINPLESLLVKSWKP